LSERANTIPGGSKVDLRESVIPPLPGTVGNQADIGENTLFPNLTVCVDIYLCDLSFPKRAVLKVL
jgi:hypothetical protein